MEDAPEDDRDIKLQKVSGDFIADFDRSLPLFLRKPDGKLRNRVRTGETTRLTSSLLDPFQELPQLLDPHLPQWLPLLANSYLEHLHTQSHRRVKPSQVPSGSLRSRLLEPLPVAVCKLLYTFTKIRGPSIVLRFLPVEARHLEPLLSALESSELRASRPSLLQIIDWSRANAMAAEPSQRDWVWEERYIVLLWLSHLLLAPFDLATISSADPDETSVVPLPETLKLPEGLPGITARILPIGVKYLASPGKERDGAKDLLVRMAMRRDMQQLGVLDALVAWALASIRPVEGKESEVPYFYIGVLSFLAGVLRSSINTSDMKKHLPAIFEAVHAVSEEESPVSEAIRSYAVARKMAIKIIRSVAVQILHQTPQDMAGTELVESSISYLLECLADNDTPVRLAASKALSVITLKLDPDMAEQVVEAVLDALNRNVLWAKDPSRPDGKPTRDLRAVEPLEWHGLMLTLSNLLYRRSPPASQLASIVHGLLLGLSFEKRSTSGSSIGTNVRDAACFGIWALARRYTTQELNAVPTETVTAAGIHPEDSSILQVLATELAVTASLDSAGNIRRGSSAALQELIGRHPDTVEKGIWVVQTVDYHAVALRSRSIQEVALKTTKLSNQYGRAILDGLLGWRGIGDPDASARRVAGSSFGTLTLQLSRQEEAESLSQFQSSIQMVMERLAVLQARQVDERHGLLLCLAAVLDKLPDLVDRHRLADGSEAINVVAQGVLREIGSLLHDANQTSYRRPELIAEAANKLAISSLPLLQLACSKGTDLKSVGLRRGPDVVSQENTQELLDVISHFDSVTNVPESVQTVLSKIGPIVTDGLARPEKEAVAAASEAALILLAFSRAPERDRIVKQWADAIRHRPTSRTTQGNGYFSALTMAHPIVTLAHRLSSDAPLDPDVATGAILARWAADNDIDIRVAILKSLTQSTVLRNQPLLFVDLLAEGLNDYTTNARGDVGSHVRLEALRATKNIWRWLDATAAIRKKQKGDGSLAAGISKLFLRVLRLAAEKLDRVRTEAHSVLALTLLPEHASRFLKLTFSSRAYFQTLLSLQINSENLHPLVGEVAQADPEAWTSALLAGYVTSADTGNEDLVIASRAALTSYCRGRDGQNQAANLNAICNALLHNLSAYQGQDRVLVPTLEIVAFLCRVGVFQGCKTVNIRRLCLLTQKAGYKTGNVRKLEACIRVYGCVAAFREDEVRVDGDEDMAGKRREGVVEARRRLGALMLHPWPRVKSLVVDELWRLFCDDVTVTGDAGETRRESEDARPAGGERAARLKGVDWARADKGAIKGLVADLGLA